MWNSSWAGRWGTERSFQTRPACGQPARMRRAPWHKQTPEKNTILGCLQTVQPPLPPLSISGPVAPGFQTMLAARLVEWKKKTCGTVMFPPTSGKKLGSAAIPPIISSFGWCPMKRFLYSVSGVYGPRHFPWTYCLFNRNPYNGFLLSPHNRVVVHPIYTLKNHVVFHCYMTFLLAIWWVWTQPANLLPPAPLHCNDLPPVTIQKESPSESSETWNSSFTLQNIENRCKTI